MVSGNVSNLSILILRIFMRILGEIYLLLLSFFYYFFHLQLQYEIHVFRRDTHPTQKQYYTCSQCVFGAITLKMCKLHFSIKKFKGFRARLPLTYKENYFPNVNFKLIFKLDKASLSANWKDFQRRRDQPPSAQAFLGESYFLPSHDSLKSVCVGGYLEIGQCIDNNCQIEWFKILRENIQGQLNSRLILSFA